jgi:flagellar basal-body rod protein FlgB
MLDNLFSSVDLLEKGSSASWLRNEVISNNIANVDTPGYKASEVKFEDLMAAAAGTEGSGLKMAVTNAKHISAQSGDLSDVEAQVVTDRSTSERLDGNNVDVEHEMSELAKNSIEYYTLMSKVNSEFRKLDSAIKVT